MLTRILSAIVVIAVVLFCMVFGITTRVLFIIGIGLIATYEMLNALKKGGYKPYIWPSYLFYAGGVAIIVAGQPVELILYLVVILIIAAFIQRCLHKDMTDRDLFSSFLPMLYPQMFFLMIMRMIWEETEYWPFLFITAVVAVVMCDSFALFTGMAFGKHKLSAISPKKTVEGLIGGLIFGSLSGLLIYWILPMFSLEVLSLPFTMAASFLASLVGVFGDLAASSVKREAGIKDYSKLIPGHGGIMDRVDSAIFAIPIVYVLYRVVQIFGM